MSGAGAADLHSRLRHVQLFSGQQLQSGQDALTEFDLAREHLHPAGLAKSQPLRQTAVGVQTARQWGLTVLTVDDEAAGLRC